MFDQLLRKSLRDVKSSSGYPSYAMLKMMAAPKTPKNRNKSRMPEPPCCHGNSLGSFRKAGPSVKPARTGDVQGDGLEKVGCGGGSVTKRLLD